MATDAPSILQQLDAQLEQILKGWNIYTTLIFIVLVSYLLYPVFFTPEPDVHPMLLARQSIAYQVRHPGESATFRSVEAPHGYPLKTGLNVKEPGAPRWTGGKDGDVRDVWKRALSGPVDNDSKPVDKPGKVLTVLGKEEVVEHSFEKMTSEIIAVGQHLQSHGGQRVAIYLPNSVELLVTFFAAIFYGLTPILVPQDQTLDTLAGILTETKADVLVAGAGAVPLNELLRKYPNLKQVVWVVARTSRHMDWNEVPEGEGGKADIAVWHDIIDEKSSAFTDLPKDIPSGELPNVVMVAEDSMSALDSYEIVELTQKNLVAAIASQITALPRNHRLSPSDVLTPLAPLTDTYPLTLTLAALFSNASLALTPVSGPKVPYTSAFTSPTTTPTIVIASSATISDYCKEQSRAQLSSTFAWLGYRWKARTLQAGVMPKASPGVTAPRLVYTYDKASKSNIPLSSTEFFNLRLFTNARFVYAFTDLHVAGAVTQTHMLDYRTGESDGVGGSKQSHFGPPLACIELKFKDSGDYRNEGGRTVGRVVVSGPAVVGGEVVVDEVLGMSGEFTLVRV
ncbi:hypothetical protein ACLMJK_001457 [Lecanora helva]